MSAQEYQPKDYRLTVKVRNNKLLRAIEAAGHAPGCAFSALVGIQYGTLNNLINMTRAPLDKNGDLRPEVEALMIFLGRPFHELFSEDQCFALDTNVAEREMAGGDVRALLDSPLRESDLLERPLDLKRLIARSVDRIDSERGREVIRLRFGLHGNGEHTLEEVGEILGVCANRVRQIEVKALRQLRHPSISNALAGVMED